MDFINPWNWIKDTSDFFVQVGKYFTQLWNWSFDIFGQTISFKTMLTTGLLLLMGWLLVKKFFL